VLLLKKRNRENISVRHFVNRGRWRNIGQSMRANETLLAQRYHFRQLLSGHHVGDAIRYSRRGRDKRGIRPTDVMPARHAASRMSEYLSDCRLGKPDLIPDAGESTP
jgi:hypothetical protein